MPSRTVVYGVGAATGILVGAAIARLNGATGRERLQRLLGRGNGDGNGPTHIVLPDLEPALLVGVAEDAVLDGQSAVRAPLTPA
ncbi:MAG TPA: hypothetical protein VH134_12680 [Candidatus Dormibacteraeota bacterium]|nr:hypothetical protein [Candidatus Dormibacteraeota bacterium]